MKAVMFDMDNTLLETQVLYEDAHVELAQLVNRFGTFPEKDVVETLRAFEVDLFTHFGYGKEMLPQAFENTLLKLVPNATDALVDEARGLAYNVYAREAQLKAGAVEAVTELSKHFRLFLVTAGDDDVQQGRIAKLAFAHLFEEIYIVPEKDRAVFEHVLAKAGLKPADAVMIGDSLRSDVHPALEAGMSAIHINAQNWAGREMAGLKLPENGVASFTNVLDAAAKIMREAGVASAPALQPRNDNQAGAPQSAPQKPQQRKP
ncbi:MAG: HAD family hydrolase [Micavibrio sp.]|nr:HAD family hydrolase [Micavibrio sp.]